MSILCINFSEFYTSYQPKQFVRYDLAIIKFKLPFQIGPDPNVERPNPICLDLNPDVNLFHEDFWGFKTLTMVGFGKENTPKHADLRFASVKLKSIDQCIKEMYPESSTKVHDENNVICVHGKSYFSLLCT